ncbi:hypothetical protein [Peptoniphilus faecalis]|uniref:hypothetical protein n=1 Tax=Peptoniphilus faecalis TaxID=2731255 RepID=UPI001B8CEF80|nr:hypothetical protein [Peptoniphilus faecalis]
MKFITEDDLRDLYFKSPFTSYEIKQGTRLTPGARQFLIDFKIDFNINNKIKKAYKKNCEDNIIDEINLAIDIKEFALSIRNIDKNFSDKLCDLSYKIYSNENLNCGIRFREINLKKEFMNINLDLKLAEKIIKSIRFEEYLSSKYEEDNNIKLLKNLIKLWAIRDNEDGDRN